MCKTEIVILNFCVNLTRVSIVAFFGVDEIYVKPMVCSTVYVFNKNVRVCESARQNFF